MVLTEPELFDFLKEYYYPDLVMSESMYSAFDCYSIKSTAYIELKSRNTHYDELLIEKMKYEAIVSQAKHYGLRPYYINSTPEGIWAFKLAKLPAPKWESRPMPATTEFENNDKINKIVGYINIKDGVEL